MIDAGLANRMRVEVVASSRGTPLRSAPIVLQQDGWDDFGFKTQYQLYCFNSEFEGLIGNLKILKQGQVETGSSILPTGPLSPLSVEFCSLGQSLDYYERLAALPPMVRADILDFFRDALAMPSHAKTFEAEKGWTTSVTRDLDLDSYVPLARTLLDRNYNALPSVGLELTFSVSGWQSPLALNFAAPAQQAPSIFSPSKDKGRLPERVAVITGRNGSGKSTLIARLARTLHASQGDRRQPEIANLGAIEPAGIGFSRIVTLAYSAFDTFQVPGVNGEERQQIVKDLRAGTGRYVFAGLRDIARELEESLAQEEELRAREEGTQEQAKAVGDTDDRFAMDRQSFTYLKSAEQLADEYARTIKAILNADRAMLLHKVLRILLADPSFSDVPEQSPTELLALNPKTSFMAWSTGHKVVMHIVATLVAHTQRKSIVLIDEPESHLHPPLLAALMHAVRTILEENDAFAVIATHSPVVAQETLGRHVSIVNRVGDTVTILPSRIETYGESIGEITDELFGLHPSATDYHETLRAMVDDGMDLDQIDGRFEHGLSLQARAYVMSLIASRTA